MNRDCSTKLHPRGHLWAKARSARGFREAGFVLHVLSEEQREIEEINIAELKSPAEFTAHEVNEFADFDSGEHFPVVMTDQENCVDKSG